MKIKVAIIGFGVVGKRRYKCLSNVSDVSDVSVVALCDTRQEMFDSLSNEIRHYDTYHRILEKEKLDAVFICLSNDMLAEASEAFFKKGVHVFCEKPPARNTKELKKVLAAEKIIQI